MKIRKDLFYKNICYQDYIYIIADQNNYIKVGISKNPDKRLKQLETGHPTKLKLISAELFECSRNNLLKIEKLIHNKISQKYKRAHGEWFEVMPEQIDDIKSIINWHKFRYEQNEIALKYNL